MSKQKRIELFNHIYLGLNSYKSPQIIYETFGTYDITELYQYNHKKCFLITKKEVTMLLRLIEFQDKVKLGSTTDNIPRGLEGICFSLMGDLVFYSL